MELDGALRKNRSKEKKSSLRISCLSMKAPFMYSSKPFLKIKL